MSETYFTQMIFFVRCIVWCKQLVLALNRALFDCINPLTHQLTLNKDHRKEVFNYHLLQRTGGNRGV